MSIELIKIHEQNKKNLESFNFNSDYGHPNARIVDIYKDNYLISYKIVTNMIGGRYERKETDFRYIRVKDSSTGKYVFLSVPNNMVSCKSAIAWTFRLSPREYELLFET